MPYINLQVEEKTYTIEYTRHSLTQMERNGFSLTQLQDKIVTSLELMFWGGLLKNHKGITLQQSNKLLDYVLDKYRTDELFLSLNTLINEVFEIDSDEDEEKTKEKKSVLIMR